MLVVVASRFDDEARALVNQWGPGVAQVLVPQGLSKPDWRWFPDHDESSTAVLNDTAVRVADITGVLTLMPVVIEHGARSHCRRGSVLRSGRDTRIPVRMVERAALSGDQSARRRWSQRSSLDARAMDLGSSSRGPGHAPTRAARRCLRRAPDHRRRSGVSRGCRLPGRHRPPRSRGGNRHDVRVAGAGTLRARELPTASCDARSRRSALREAVWIAPVILLLGMASDRPLTAVASALRRRRSPFVFLDQAGTVRPRVLEVPVDHPGGTIAAGSSAVDLTAVTSAYLRPSTGGWTAADRLVHAWRTARRHAW